MKWELESVHDADAEYGDGGPDTSAGFDAYRVVDEHGWVLFDSLNRDSRASEIHEEFCGEFDGHHAWDEMARRDLTLAAVAPDLLEALKEVVAISDRDHDAWDRAKAAIARAEKGGR
jgi:hypothetical protein